MTVNGRDELVDLNASMEAFDETILEAALREASPYRGLIASEVRTPGLIDRLNGKRDEWRSGVDQPGGTETDAKPPEEIAFSVFKGMITVGRGGELAPDRTTDAGQNSPQSTDEASTEATATNPVCEMAVTIGEEAASAALAGQVARFCTPGVPETFKAESDQDLDSELEAQ